ncbi:F23F12.8 [Symbiodinium sp. CCMP2592]|nr:F23F12.8 [Symbiodinium sp. CCMP2592]
MLRSCVPVENVCFVPKHNQTDVGLWDGVIAWRATKVPSRTASFLIAAPTVSSKVRTALQSSPESEGAVCAINMREMFSGLETKRCCEEETEASCSSCCEKHFILRGQKCVDVCSTMCSFGWSGNQKVPQCPEKLGSEEGGAEEWYAEDPMKDRPRPAVPDTKADTKKKVDKAISLGF